MREALLEQGNLATALGADTDRVWARLMAGESGVAPVTRFDPGALGYGLGACLPGLEPDGEPNRTCALMTQCLKGLELPEPLPPETPLIWAGCKGGAEAIEARAGKQASEGAGGSDNPEAEAAGMPELAEDYRQWLAAKLGLDGKAGMTVNAACASSAAALAIAAQWVATGRYERVCVGAADIVSRFTHCGFAALRALSPGRCRPFDRRRDGLALGDGAMIAIVSSRAALGGRPALARLAGWALTNDATHITAPARDGGGLTEAIRLALASAGLNPEALAAFCAHGTGTVYNDAMELTAAGRIFGERRFPMTSVKGATGHTLGAAGGIEALLCARALAERRLPPTWGLEEPEPGAEGRFSAAPQAIGPGAILTTNSGFGGVNAALILTADGGGEAAA